MVVLPPLSPGLDVQRTPRSRLCEPGLGRVRPSPSPRGCLPQGSLALEAAAAKSVAGCAELRPRAVADLDVAGGDPHAPAFRWRGVQERSHDGADTVVPTLGLCWMPSVSSGALVRVAKASVMSVEKENFQVDRTLQCHKVAENFVFCRGTVRSRVAQLPAVVARLPKDCLPPRPLCFAALAREEGTARAQLAMLLARPDGLIVQVGGGCAGISIDLSAVRFFQDKGISLADEVSLHVLDVAGTRVVNLQGGLRQKEFRGCRRAALAKLPVSCRPPGSLVFITAGDGPGAFNVVGLTPHAGSSENGHGGELHWRDSYWRRDKLNMSGVTFEVDPAVLSVVHHVRTEEVLEVLNFKKMRDFRSRMVHVYGSLEKGMVKAFGLHGDREIGFGEFAAGCKLLGYGYEVTRLWEILDEDRSGGISAAELLGRAPDPAEGAVSIAGASSSTATASGTRATTATSNGNRSIAEDNESLTS